MRPMRDVLIRNNTVASNTNAFKIGTETHGAIRDVVFRDNRVTFGGRCALTVQSADGAHIENITFENIVIEKAAVPIFLRLGDRGRRIKAYANPVGTFNGQTRLRTPEDPEVGTMRNITFRNIVAKDVGAALPPKKMLRSIGSAFSGVNGHKIENIVLENLDFTYGGGVLDRQKTYAEVPENPDKYPTPEIFGELPAYAFYFRHVDGVRMKNVYVRYLERDCRSALVFDNAHTIELTQVYVQRDQDAAPAVEFFRGSDGSQVSTPFIQSLDRYLVEGIISGKKQKEKN
jgi:polygalacturonase